MASSLRVGSLPLVDFIDDRLQAEKRKRKRGRPSSIPTRALLVAAILVGTEYQPINGPTTACLLYERISEEA